MVFLESYAEEDSDWACDEAFRPKILKRWAKKMALYEIVISRSVIPAKTVAVVRTFSPTSMSVIKSKIDAREVVISVSSDDYPVGAGRVDGPRGQHELFKHCLVALAKIGDEVEVRYRPSTDYPYEVVDRKMLANLMESELVSRSQLHD